MHHSTIRSFRFAEATVRCLLYISFRPFASHNLQSTISKKQQHISIWGNVTTESAREAALAIETVTTQIRTSSMSGVIRSIPFPHSRQSLLTCLLMRPSQTSQRTIGTSNISYGRTDYCLSRSEQRQWSLTSSVSLVESQATKTAFSSP